MYSFGFGVGDFLKVKKEKKEKKVKKVKKG